MKPSSSNENQFQLESNSEQKKLDWKRDDVFLNWWWAHSKWEEGNLKKNTLKRTETAATFAYFLFVFFCLFFFLPVVHGALSSAVLLSSFDFITLSLMTDAMLMLSPWRPRPNGTDLFSFFPFFFLWFAPLKVWPRERIIPQWVAI